MNSRNNGTSSPNRETTVVKYDYERNMTLEAIATQKEVVSIWPELDTYESDAARRTAVWRVERNALKKMKEILAAAGLEEGDIYYGRQD